MTVEREAGVGPAYIDQAKCVAAEVVGLAENTPLRPIHSVGIIGAGTMGGGIAMNFLSAGLPVTLVDTSRESLDRGVTTVKRNYDGSVARGKLTPDQVAQAMRMLTPTLDFEVLSRSDLIIEAVYENLSVKLEIFERLGKLAKAGAVLASNTSFLDINQMAEASGRPGDVLGTHFFSPAYIMKLVEVVRGSETAPDALATVINLARRLNKVPVVSAVCYGFIGNRMLMQRQNAATAMLLEGASPEQIDRIHTSFGMPMGPFQMADLAGLDIGWHRDSTRMDSIQDALCASGRWGLKTNAGYYDYPEPRTPVPSAITAQILAAFRARHGAPARTLSDEEVVTRTLYTLVNEGARILEEGIAQRASDIDVVWVFGFGWPLAKGGPMFWADSVGLGVILDSLERQLSHLPPDFKISSLLREKANSVKSFTSG